MWNKIKSEFDKNENKYDKRANFALIVGVLSLVFAPILLTQFSWRFNFTETGQIGDTIGGTATPILSFIGAILVYYSFKQQMAANRIQINALLDEKQSKNEMQIVEFCDRIQREVIEKINAQKVEKHSVQIAERYTRGYLTTYGIEAISLTLKALDRLQDHNTIEPVYKPCFDSITIIFRNVKLLLTYIDKIENETIQEMLFNSYYNNLHLFLFVDNIEQYLFRKAHGPNERRIVKLCISIDDLFNKLDSKYMVQNKWLIHPQYQN